MDDEKFKIELLNRLDKIIALLSLSCSMSKAALERTQPGTAKPQPPSAEQAGSAASSSHFLLQDEMQEDYDLAVQKWKSSRLGR